MADADAGGAGGAGQPGNVAAAGAVDALDNGTPSVKDWVEGMLLQDALFPQS